MNDLALSAALATAPSSAFGELRERPRFWFPLVLMVVVAAVMVGWYYSVVDIDWLKDAMFAHNPKMQDSQRAAAMGMITRTTLLWGSVVGCIIVTPVIYLIQSLVLLVAAKITKVPLGFKHWFSMATWTSLPGLLSFIVAAVLIVLSDNNQISSMVMQPLSINELLLHRPPGSPGEGLLASLSIPGVLSWVLMIIGVRAWSQRSWVFSALFVLLPVAVIDGVWAFFAFR